MKRIFQRAFTLFVAILFCSVSAIAASTTTPAATIEAASSTAHVAEVPVPTPDVAAPTVDKTPTIIPTAPQLDSAGYVLMDANTGMILAHKNMHEKMQPASLTKLMTLFLTFQAL